MDNPTVFAEKVILHNDNGNMLDFQGRMFSESSFFDEQTSTLTRIRLYATNDGHHVYSIVSGAGPDKSRRYYVVTPGKETCEISDGIHQAILIPTEMLFASVFGLCGIDPDRADDLRPAFEETLRLASGG